MEVLLSIIAIIIALVIDWIIANAFAEAAELKGHGERKYFWFCFLFGLVGYLLVIALPDLNGTASQYAQAQRPAPAPVQYNSYPPVQQPHTPATPAPQQPVSSLGTNGNTIFHDGSWQCTCGRKNAPYVSTCACGKSKRG
jgi:hypothetical protein